jgi:hypothetical protein
MLIATEPKAKDNFRTAVMLAFANISKVYYHTSLQDLISPKVRVDSVAPAARVPRVLITNWTGRLPVM